VGGRLDPDFADSPVSGVRAQRRLNLFLRSTLGLSSGTRSNTLIESRIAVGTVPNHPVGIQTRLPI
jgi:hypothetical protein